MFLRPLDEERPLSAKKVSAKDASGAPRRAFLVQKREEIAQGHSKGSKNPENAIPKSMEKIRPKQNTKFIPNAFQNHTKTDTKIVDLLYFCEKGWNAPNCLFSNRKRGSGHPTTETISWKIYAKRNEHDIEKEPK